MVTDNTNRIKYSPADERIHRQEDDAAARVAEIKRRAALGLGQVGVSEGPRHRKESNVDPKAWQSQTREPAHRADVEWLPRE